MVAPARSSVHTAPPSHIRGSATRPWTSSRLPPRAGHFSASRRSEALSERTVTAHAYTMSGAALFNLAQTALTSDAGNISSSSSRDGLARAASMPLQRQRTNGAAKPPLEWRRFLTVEDCVEINQCVDLREPPRHRADAVTATTSRRWPGKSSRRSYGENIASMA